MEFRPDRRRWLANAAGLALALPTLPSIAAAPRRPFQIYAVLFRGMTDVEKGFAAGADDYITKPFSPRELLVRLEAILERA